MRDALTLHAAYGRDRAGGAPRVQAHLLPVRDVMSTAPIGVDVQTPLRTAYALMQQRRVTDLLVYDADRFVGVLSEHAVIADLYGEARQPGAANEAARGVARVSQAVTPGPVCTSEMPVEEAAALMLHHHASCLPVQSHSGRVIGVVTPRDLIHLLA